ncbi:MAG: DNA repair protein RadA [bacterium]|nr:DNA repair protein RadA [bacterium]
MGSKNQVAYFCQECGYENPRWLGKCPSCQSWNTLVEEVKNFSTLAHTTSPISTPQYLYDINPSSCNRLSTNILEFDRTLGGGIVKGSLVLIGGDPGIGKSTLLLQVSQAICNQHGEVLYISGEESIGQIKIRADRLNISCKNLSIYCENNLTAILEQINKLNPQLVIIDSIQTVFIPELSSSLGSISQVRESTSKLLFQAKNKDIPIFLIGHVTKEGAIAGPRVLEHIVDVVLYLEGEEHYFYRILRSVKNRFGSTNEIGIFEMQESGLMEVSNPSQLFLTDHCENSPGSTITPTIEGSRCILVELQSLVTNSNYNLPRRDVLGFNFNRLHLLVAVLEKKIGINLSTSDVFVNLAGGLKINEPAADLGIACSIVSSFKNIPIDSQTIILGEVGLTGEVRRVGQAEKRIKEAIKLGFKNCLLPASNVNTLPSSLSINLMGVKTINEAINSLF